MFNIQVDASNLRSFNAEPTSQGPSLAEIRKAEVQKDASTPASPTVPKGPQSSQEKKGGDDDEEQSA